MENFLFKSIRKLEERIVLCGCREELVLKDYLESFGCELLDEMQRCREDNLYKPFSQGKIRENIDQFFGSLESNCTECQGFILEETMCFLENYAHRISLEQRDFSCSELRKEAILERENVFLSFADFHEELLSRIEREFPRTWNLHHLLKDVSDKGIEKGSHTTVGEENSFVSDEKMGVESERTDEEKGENRFFQNRFCKKVFEAFREVVREEKVKREIEEGVTESENEQLISEEFSDWKETKENREFCTESLDHWKREEHPQRETGERFTAWEEMIERTERETVTGFAKFEQLEKLPPVTFSQTTATSSVQGASASETFSDQQTSSEERDDLFEEPSYPPKKRQLSEEIEEENENFGSFTERSSLNKWLPKWAQLSQLRRDLKRIF